MHKVLKNSRNFAQKFLWFTVSGSSPPDKVKPRTMNCEPKNKEDAPNLGQGISLIQ